MSTTPVIVGIVPAGSLVRVEHPGAELDGQYLMVGSNTGPASATLTRAKSVPGS